MSKNKTSKSDDNNKSTNHKPRKPRQVVLQPSGAKTKQRCNFARFLAEHGDKARARREAMYKESKNEYVLACRLGDEPDVKDALAYWAEKAVKKLDLRTEAILGEIHTIAFSNISDVWEWDDVKGVLILKDITKLPRSVTAAIKSISAIQRTYFDASIEEEITETAYKVEMHNKWNALKHIADLVKQLKPHTTSNSQGGTEKNRKVVELRINSAKAIGDNRNVPAKS